MSRRRWRIGVAIGAALAAALAACGGPADEGPGTATKAEFNVALDKVFNPSDTKGGILKMAHADDIDTTDPGEMYYGVAWNLVRTYGRALVMYKPVPGTESSQIVPDLAEGLGKSSDGGKTWEYKLRKGVRYEDGTEVTSADVKHAVLRSIDKETFPNGPAYFEQFLDLPKDYKGPYKSKKADTDSAIETPDEQTIIFHLKVPFAGFDNMAALPQTIPVPEKADKGAKYREHVLSTGPYKFKTSEQGKRYVLERNPEWDPKTDPNRKPLVDGYDIELKVDQNDLDNRLIDGDLHVDLQGTGVGPAAQSKILSNPDLKSRADNPTIARLWYTSINSQVKPLDNIDCRKAIMYAMDQTAYQTAYGGEFAGGELATGLMPPLIEGYQKFDLYPNGKDHKGDLAKAKEHLKACGKPEGFSIKMAYRSERPKETATAEAFQESLKRVGIELQLKGFPDADYFSQYAGNPPYMRKNGFGLATNGWGADWNDGFGFLSQIVDSRVIRETGGSSNMSVRIPEVDKMIDKAVLEQDEAARNKLWGEMDKRVMEEAVVYPGVYAKALVLRGESLTNVFYNAAFGQYDYMALGLEEGSG